MQCPPQLERLLRRLLPAWISPALVFKAMSFATIGCLNGAIDFSLFSLGHLYFGLPIIPANLISWAVAVTNSYVLNSMFTFAAESGRRLTLRRYFAFAATQVGGLVANTATVLVASYFVPVLAAKVLAIGASFVFDFTLSHLVVFHRREQTPQP